MHTTAAVTRSLQTRAGVVSATCRDGLVRLGASPAVGWRIADIDPGPAREAKVRFRADEDELEVNARCADGRPRFGLEADSDDSDDSDPADDGSGGGDESGGTDDSADA